MTGVDLPHPDGADDVLAQPTRRRLFALLAELGGSATTDELARGLAMHPNGVRAHLRRMAGAGLIERRRPARPRGRPRDEWALRPEARPGGDPPQAYAALARWLARAIPATPERLREVEAAARSIGTEIAPGARGSPEQRILDVFAALGFQPRVAARDGERMSCHLENCPYRDSVRENQPVVCSLHRGITRGVLDRLAPGASLAAFVPHDPERAGCEVDIRGLARA